jgi:hypothetical protein
MRFLFDQCLSPDFAQALAAVGHDIVHVRNRGMQRAGDPEVLQLARSEGRILVSADTDFGTILAQTSAIRAVGHHLPPHDRSAAGRAGCAAGRQPPGDHRSAPRRQRRRRRRGSLASAPTPHHRIAAR